MVFSKSRGLINDSISDMLTRIRNATLAKKSNVNIPFTNLNQELAQILEKEGLVVSAKKCKFGKSSLLFLGHIVDGNGIRTNPEKIQKIVDFPSVSFSRGALSYPLSPVYSQTFF